MQSAPSTIYSQSIDKQRVVIAGKSKARITAMIAHVLKLNKSKVDLSTSITEQISDAPTIVIEANGDAKSLKEYKHHILIFGPLPAAEKDIYLILADSTPKSGGIFFDDTDELAKSIGKKERADVLTIPFSIPKHEMKNGTATLVSSTNEKFPTKLTSVEDLKNCNAAKEFLKKIGITSGQFYKAISTFQ
jgi:UDP-N-acetylmuramate: L-alanyl-gamma-D-glutamyl-meso-diaminopimelate ligase